MPITVLIPALNPSDGLLRMADELLAHHEVTRLLIINDGSAPAYEEVFDRLAPKSRVEVLRHPINLGKGAALRTGLNRFLGLAAPGEQLVTADADGQHLTRDILAVAARAGECPDSLVLGVRGFAGKVPLRSRFGNSLTRFIFRLVTGRSISDTQTGLRAIPRLLMPRLLKVGTNGYDFEMEMLILAVQGRVKIHSVGIETVYLDGNASSHFDPVRDSLRIYFVFLRFISPSILTAVLDFLVFCMVFQFTNRLGPAMVLGRLVAGTFNFQANKTLVLLSRGSMGRALFRFVTLAAVLTGIAYSVIDFLVTHHGWNPYFTKLGVESILLIFSFLLQRDVVFASPAASLPDEV